MSMHYRHEVQREVPRRTGLTCGAGQPNKVDNAPVGSLEFEDFHFHKAEGMGLGPQTLLAAFQFPRIGFGLGIEHVFAGSFIDLVTAANTTLAGSMAPVPCQRSQLTLTGSVGVEGLLWGSRPGCQCGRASSRTIRM
jgi:hypothetical protein